MGSFGVIWCQYSPLLKDGDVVNLSLPFRLLRSSLHLLCSLPPSVSNLQSSAQTAGRWLSGHTTSNCHDWCACVCVCMREKERESVCFGVCEGTRSPHHYTVLTLELLP